MIAQQIRIRIRQILHMKSSSNGCRYWLAPSHPYRLLGRSKLLTYFSPFKVQSSPNSISISGRDCSLQHLFCVWHYLVAFRRYLESSCEIARNLMILGCQFLQGGPQISYRNIINLSHYWTWSKVWIWSTERPNMIRCWKKTSKYQLQKITSGRQHHCQAIITAQFYRKQRRSYSMSN